MAPAAVRSQPKCPTFSPPALQTPTALRVTELAGCRVTPRHRGTSPRGRRAVSRENAATNTYGTDHSLLRPTAQVVSVAVLADLDTTVVAHPAANYTDTDPTARSA